MRLTVLAATALGRSISGYGRWVIRSSQVVFDGPSPPTSAILVTWHELTMLTLAVAAELIPHPYCAFVTPGIRGTAMRAWLTASNMVAVPLPAEGAGNPIHGLKQMARALGDNHTVGIALDGPRGPRRIMRPGALWVARLTGRPLIVVGAAASPAVRMPRWDHHVMPLPGSRVSLVYGEPMTVERGTELDGALCSRVTHALESAERRACENLTAAPTTDGRPHPSDLF